MIERETISGHLQGILEGTGIFPVDVRVDRNNRIVVQVDRKEGISIDECAQVSRALEGKLDRDSEDFALEVSSPGLDSPFKVTGQYEKSLGKKITVQCNDGRSYQGILLETSKEGIRMEILPGMKGKVPSEQELEFSEIRSARLQIEF